jgi:hypothetical protein
MLLVACGSTVRLHAPVIAESTARTMAAKLELEPITMKPGADAGTSVNGKRVGFEHPDPAAALTAGIRAELAGRALQGGEPGGYAVRCSLERFAMRTQTNMAGTRAYAVLYADLACDAERTADHALVWRGMLRGRATAMGGSTFGRDASMMQKLADRMMSDAARELASDLAVRALDLVAGASARVFADEDERATLGGIDDTSLGAAALTESAEKAAQVAPLLHDSDASIRAAAWNIVAMASGPGDPWALGDVFTPDDELTVRFYQYKALAREASAATMAQLRGASAHEDESILSELARDALGSGGLTFPRTKANADTNGTTIKP